MFFAQASFSPEWFGIQANAAAVNMMAALQAMFIAFQPMILFMVGISLLFMLLRMFKKV